MAHHCYKCRSEVPGRDFGRSAACPSCGTDVRVCLNCEHYDTGAHHECREPQAEWVREKDRGNFCDYFQFRLGAAHAEGSTPQADARKKLDDLFKK